MQNPTTTPSGILCRKLERKKDEEREKMSSIMATSLRWRTHSAWTKNQPAKIGLDYYSIWFSDH